MKRRTGERHLNRKVLLMLSAALLVAFAIGGAALAEQTQGNDVAAGSKVKATTESEQKTVVEKESRKADETKDKTADSEKGKKATAKASSSIVKLDLYKGAPSQGGTKTADMLKDSSVNMEPDEVYYLDVAVKKAAVTDDCWVSIDLPYWLKPINMPGGSAWRTKGDIGHTSLDKVLSYSTAAGGSYCDGKVITNAGKVTYHIKGGATTATFQAGVKPIGEYYNNSGSQESPEKIKVASGSMSGSNIGAQDAERTVSVVRATSDTVYNVRTDVHDSLIRILEGTDTTSITLTGYQGVVKSIEFDFIYPTIMNVTGQKLRGKEITPEKTTTEGSNTIEHYSVNFDNGYMFNSLVFTTSLPASAVGNTYTAYIKNVKQYAWGDDSKYDITGDDEVFGSYDFEVLARLPETVPPQFMKGANTSKESYNWQAETNENVNTMTSWFYFIGGQPEYPESTTLLDNKTIHIENPVNSVVRMFTVPYGEGAADYIRVKADGTWNTYNVEDVIYKRRTNDSNKHLVIRNIDLGLDKDANIEEIEYVMGKLPTSYDAGDFYNGSVDLTAIACWGGIKDDKDAVTKCTIYNTGTDPDDPANTSVLKGTKTFKAAAKPLVQLLSSNVTPTNYGELVMTAGEMKNCKFNLNIGSSYGNSAYYEDPVLYFYVPKWMNVDNLKADGKETTLEDITAQATGLTAGDRIYKAVITGSLGRYNEDFKTDNVDITYDMKIKRNAETATYNKAVYVMIGKGDIDADIEDAGVDDTYNINGGDKLKQVVVYNKAQIHESKSVTIDNAFKVVKKSDGSQVTDWLQYYSNDKAGTTAKVDSTVKGLYRLDIENNAGGAADNLNIFVPIPKKGDDWGDAFNPEGAFEYDMTFDTNKVPEGYKVEYIKVTAGKTYAEGTAPAPADYTVVSNSKDANFVKITDTASMGADEASQVIFDVSLSDSADSAGKINIWNSISAYNISGVDFVSKGYAEAVEYAGGAITGTVYYDDNGNSVMDAWEKGVEGTTVELESSDGVAYTTELDENGEYTFKGLRATVKESGYVNSGLTYTVKVNNINNYRYAFSNVVNSGNKPNSVTGTTGEAYGEKSGIELISDEEVVDAGLTGHETIHYISGKKGSISGVASEKVICGRNPVNVPTATADSGYAFLGWSLNSAVTANDDITAAGATYAAGTKIPSGTLLTTDQLKKVSVTKELYATTDFGGSGHKVTYKYTGTVPEGAPGVPAVEEDIISGTAVPIAPEPLMIGYTFSGWKTSDVKFAAGNFNMPSKDVTFTGTWIAPGSAQYQVEYYKQDLTGGKYTLAESETLSGTIGENAVVNQKDYPGFKVAKVSAKAESIPIKADGSLVVEVLYDRNKNTPYKVEHYKEKTTGGAYALADVEDLTGTTGAPVTASAKSYSGYTENKTYKGRVATGSIEGDGSSVLKLYYSISNSESGKTVSVTPKVTKAISGSPAEDVDFQFSLVGDDGTESTAQITGEGTTAFDKMSFKAPGTYRYSIEEVDTGEKGYKYDTSIYGMTVEVAKNSAGELSAKTTYTKSGETVETVKFSNRYVGDATKDADEGKTVSATVNSSSANGGGGSSASGGHSSSAQTGDNSNVVPYILILVGAAAIICVILVLGKRRKRDQK